MAKTQIVLVVAGLLLIGCSGVPAPRVPAPPEVARDWADCIRFELEDEYIILDEVTYTYKVNNRCEPAVVLAVFWTTNETSAPDERQQLEANLLEYDYRAELPRTSLRGGSSDGVSYTMTFHVSDVTAQPTIGWCTEPVDEVTGTIRGECREIHVETFPTIDGIIEARNDFYFSQRPVSADPDGLRDCVGFRWTNDTAMANDDRAVVEYRFRLDEHCTEDHPILAVYTTESVSNSIGSYAYTDTTAVDSDDLVVEIPYEDARREQPEVRWCAYYDSSIWPPPPDVARCYRTRASSGPVETRPIALPEDFEQRLTQYQQRQAGTVTAGLSGLSGRSCTADDVQLDIGIEVVQLGGRPVSPSRYALTGQHKCTGEHRVYMVLSVRIDGDWFGCRAATWDISDGSSLDNGLLYIEYTSPHLRCGLDPERVSGLPDSYPAGPALSTAERINDYCGESALGTLRDCRRTWQLVWNVCPAGDECWPDFPSDF